MTRSDEGVGSLDSAFGTCEDTRIGAQDVIAHSCKDGRVLGRDGGGVVGTRHHGGVKAKSVVIDTSANHRVSSSRPVAHPTDNRCVKVFGKVLFPSHHHHVVSLHLVAFARDDGVVASDNSVALTSHHSHVNPSIAHCVALAGYDTREPTLSNGTLPSIAHRDRPHAVVFARHDGGSAKVNFVCVARDDGGLQTVGIVPFTSHNGGELFCCDVVFSPHHRRIISGHFIVHPTHNR